MASASPEAMTTLSLRERILGAWSLVSATVLFGDGSRRDAFGPSPVGFLIYSPDGYMSAYLEHANRPRFESDDISRATVVERADAAAAALAYCGPYSVDEATQTLTHNVVVSLFPNWIGTSQKREAHFDGGQLILTSVSQRRGETVTAEMTWARLLSSP